MEVLEKIQLFFDNLSEADFYKYLAITLGSIVFLVIIMVIYFIRGIDSAKSRIDLIQEQRIEAKKILAREELVKKQREEVDSELAKDSFFKIKDYFSNRVIPKLNLTDKNVLAETSQVDQGEYKESILKAKLTDMSMKNVADLLNELDQNKRIFTKELEIIKSTKRPKTIDVNLTISTLVPKGAPIT